MDRNKFLRITKGGLSKPLRQRGEKVFLVIVVSAGAVGLVGAKDRFDRRIKGGGAEVIREVGGEGGGGGGFSGEGVVVG